MENCVVREIKDFNRLVGLFLLASSMKDENAKNYSIEKMKIRWHNYKLFTVLEYNNAPVSFSGVYNYGNNLVRVCDRLFTNPDYRQKSMTKNVKEKLRPVVDWFLYLIKQNGQKKMVMIVSFLFKHQRKEML